MSKKILVSFIVLFVLGFCVSCKSIGYHVEGISHIIRHDTITTRVISDKPITTEKVVDLK